MSSQMRMTTTLLADHLWLPLAQLIESYILPAPRPQTNADRKGRPKQQKQNDYDPESCARAGHWELATIKHDIVSATFAFSGACSDGNLEMMAALRPHVINMDDAVACAVLFRQPQALATLAAYGANMNMGVRFIPRTNDIHMAHDLVSLGATNLLPLLMCARYRRFDMVAMAISAGVTNYRFGLFKAAMGGDWGICLLMFHLGGNKQEMTTPCIIGACKGGRYNIIARLFTFIDAPSPVTCTLALGAICKIISKYLAKRKALTKGHYAIMELVIDNGAFECTECQRSLADHLAQVIAAIGPAE